MRTPSLMTHGLPGLGAGAAGEAVVHAQGILDALDLPLAVVQWRIADGTGSLPTYQVSRCRTASSG